LTIGGEYYELDLVDTFGLEDYYRLRPLSYANADVFVVVFSVVVPRTLESARELWIREISKFAPRVPYLLVGLETELRDDPEVLFRLASQEQKPISYEKGLKWANNIGAVKYLEASSRRSEFLPLFLFLLLPSF